MMDSYAGAPRMIFKLGFPLNGGNFGSFMGRENADPGVARSLPSLPRPRYKKYLGDGVVNVS